MTIEITWPPRFVRLCKIGETRDPVAPATAACDYAYGLPATAPFPVWYTVDGWLLRLPQIGEPVRVIRFARNDVVFPGIFETTEVVEIPRAGEFATSNSVYFWKEIGAQP